MSRRRMREQLDPPHPKRECASSWIHNASKENAQAAGFIMPQNRMRKQLNLQCLETECASSWIHNTPGENAQAAGSTIPWGRMRKQVDPQRSGGECASNWIHDALGENTQTAGSTMTQENARAAGSTMPRSLGLYDSTDRSIFRFSPDCLYIWPYREKCRRFIYGMSKHFRCVFTEQLTLLYISRASISAVSLRSNPLCSV